MAMFRRRGFRSTDRRDEIGPVADLALGSMPTPKRNRVWCSQHVTPLKLVWAIIGASLVTSALLFSAGADAVHFPLSPNSRNATVEPTTTPNPSSEYTAETCTSSECQRIVNKPKAAFTPPTRSEAYPLPTPRSIPPPIVDRRKNTQTGRTEPTDTEPEATPKPGARRQHFPPNLIPDSETETPGSRTTTARPTAATETTATTEPTAATEPTAGTTPTVVKETCNRGCWSRDCMHAARVARDKMNSTVNPCEDFYNYACGSHIAKNEIPDEVEVATTLAEAHHLLKSQLVALLNETINENHTKLENLPKSLYQLCMNTLTIEAPNHEPLLRLLFSLQNIIDAVGGWPSQDGDNWNPNSTWSWEKSMKGLRSLGFTPANYFINVSVGVDLKNASRRIIYVDQPTLVKVKFKNVIGEYTRNQHIVEIATRLGANETIAQLDLVRSQEFQFNMTKISSRRTPTELYNPTSVKELQREYPYMNWTDYINAMLMDTGIEIDENEIISVQNVSYVKRLGRLLANTDDRNLANYVIRRTINFALNFLPVQLLNLTCQTHDVFNHPNSREWMCLDITNERLPIAVGALYVRNYFTEASRRSAVDMVNEIRNAFVVLLKSADRMDNVTREIAVEKLDSMDFHIGYPDELMDDKMLNEYYRSLEFKPNDTYLNTIMAIDRFATTKKFEKLRQPVNKTDWTDHSKQFGFGDFYSFSENSIQFPATYFQREIFLNGRPKYMNYGAIGLIIAREITRGFYGTGRLFDKHGNPTEARLVEPVVPNKCLMDQYDKYMDPTEFLGLRTLVENIADNGGLKVAYHAYRKWAEGKDLEPCLPQFDLTPAKMFWLSVAQTWCSVHRSENSWKNTTIRYVPPGQVRVLGSMSNSIEFSEDFSCPPGSPMNPTEKCKIW